MEYSIEDIDKMKIGDILVLDINPVDFTFPNEYEDAIKNCHAVVGGEMAAFIFAKEHKTRILFKDKTFKKIGIVVDNYKLEKMKSELFKKGYKCIAVNPYIGETTSITLYVPKDQFQKSRDEIFSVLTLVESHFKRRN